MTSRYYVSPPLVSGEVRLDESEARHCHSVMRARTGDKVEVFDGEGRFAHGTLVQCDRKQVLVDVDYVQNQQQSTSLLRLIVSLPKGDRQKWLVEKCVELNVATLTPLMTTRSVAQPTAKALERLRRTVIESSKQCGRNHLMNIDTPVAFADAVGVRSDNEHCLIAHPYQAKPLVVALDSRRTCVLIGPEGGFSDDEVRDAIERRWCPVSLGDTILRVETAALTIAALHFAR